MRKSKMTKQNYGFTRKWGAFCAASYITALAIFGTALYFKEPEVTSEAQRRICAYDTLDKVMECEKKFTIGDKEK